MGDRGRSLFGLMLVGCSAVALYLWRNRRHAQDCTRAILAASDYVRDFVKSSLRRKRESVKSEAKPKQVANAGLAAPEARPLSSLDQLLAWSPDPAADPDVTFWQTYNAPLMLLPNPRLNPVRRTPRHSTLAPPHPPTLQPTSATTPSPPSLPAPAATTERSVAVATATATATAAVGLMTTPFAPAVGCTEGTAAAAGAAAAGGDGEGGGLGSGSRAIRWCCPRGRPRLLVCHDMMGGYLADRLVQGADDPGFFRLWQWDQVDVFIYFSHHLVTLPPPGWIAAAHRSGVRVLGTFITEGWRGGQAVCEALLSSPATARLTAERLVALAAYCGFDGWLVNIENGLRRETVPHLLTFVGHLRARMEEVVGPHALVVWYDAVTTAGRLAWQNGLTTLNAPYFDVADALFVNYTWKEGAPAAVAAEAGGRAADVFMGVDVFGRGSYGGGKDNCPVALSAARSAGVSVALFAPGWVYEEFPRDTFEPRQEAFWTRIRAVWPPRPALLQRLPLATCFGGGGGRAVWLAGRRVSSAPWYNMAAQDVVATTSPLAQQAPAGGGFLTPSTITTTSTLSVRPTQQLAFYGGCCLALQVLPADEAEVESEMQAAAAPPPPQPFNTTATITTLMRGPPWRHQLYSANLLVPAAGLDLSYTVACSGSSRVAVLLHTAPLAAEEAAVEEAHQRQRQHHQEREQQQQQARSAGCDSWLGVAVGPWGPGDRAVVEALRRAGYACIACSTDATDATTSPLTKHDAPGAATAAASAAAVAPSVPAGLPWVTCAAYLPYNLVVRQPSGGGDAAAATAIITAVGIACYLTAGGDRPAPRGSTTGLMGATASSASGGAVASVAVDGGCGRGGDGATNYQAFLGRLVLREHRASDLPQRALEGALGETATATAVEPPLTATAAAGPLVAAAAAAAVPTAAALSGGCCFRVQWGRPGNRRPESLGATSSDSLGGPSGGCGGATAAAATLCDGRQVSGELVDNAVEEDEDSERSSNGGGDGGSSSSATGGSPVKVVAPAPDGAAAADDSEGDVTLSGGIASDSDGARLLTCELSWEPQFERDGMPRHRSYHVWAYFSSAKASATPAALATTSAPAVAATASGRPTQRPSPAAFPLSGGLHAGGGSGSAIGDDIECAWEVLHPDWSGAVWVGEAFVACYRLVQLEVPGWARSVTLLVQPVTWEAVELGQLQPLACLEVPPG